MRRLSTERCIDKIPSKVLLQELPESIELANGVTLLFSYSDKFALATTEDKRMTYFISLRRRGPSRVIYAIPRTFLGEIRGLCRDWDIPGFW